MINVGAFQEIISYSSGFGEFNFHFVSNVDFTAQLNNFIGEINGEEKEVEGFESVFFPAGEYKIKAEPFDPDSLLVFLLSFPLTTEPPQWLEQIIDFRFLELASTGKQERTGNPAFPLLANQNVFDLGVKPGFIAGKDARYFYYKTSINDDPGIAFPDCEWFDYAYSGSSISTIKLPNLDPGKVTHVNGMFENCELADSIEDINLPEAVEARDFLRGCSGLTFVNELIFTKAEDVRGFFAYTGLTEPPVIAIPAAIDVSHFFEGSSLVVANDIALSNVLLSNGFFTDCANLEIIDSVDMRFSEDSHQFADNCSSLDVVVDLNLRDSSRVGFANCGSISTFSGVNFGSGTFFDERKTKIDYFHEVTLTNASFPAAELGDRLSVSQIIDCDISDTVFLVSGVSLAVGTTFGTLRLNSPEQSLIIDNCRIGFLDFTETPSSAFPGMYNTIIENDVNNLPFVEMVNNTFLAGNVSGDLKVFNNNTVTRSNFSNMFLFSADLTEMSGNRFIPVVSGDFVSLRFFAANSPITMDQVEDMSGVICDWSGALSGCPNIEVLENFVFLQTNEYVSLSSGAFDDCQNLNEVRNCEFENMRKMGGLIDCPNLTTMENVTFRGQLGSIRFESDSLETVSGFTLIGTNSDSLFSGCQNLSEVTGIDIPGGAATFFGCSSLQFINGSVGVVGNDCFSGCVLLPDLSNTTGSYEGRLLRVFRNCELLTEVPKYPITGSVNFTGDCFVGMNSWTVNDKIQFLNHVYNQSPVRNDTDSPGLAVLDDSGDIPDFESVFGILDDFYHNLPDFRVVFLVVYDGRPRIADTGAFPWPPWWYDPD